MASPSGLFREPYKPEDWAIPYSVTNARVIIAAGGTGSGKTHSNKMLFTRMAALYGGEWLAICSTIGRSKLLQFEQILKVINPSVLIKVRQAPDVSITLRAAKGKTARISFEGADDSSIKAEGSKRGIEVNGVWVTECTLVNEDLDAQLHLRTRVSERAVYLYDTNPDAINHWLIRKYFPKSRQIPFLKLDSPWQDGAIYDEEESVYWQFLTINHNSHLKPENVKQIIKDAGDPNGYWYRRMILGHWCAPEGPIWDSSARDFACKMAYA